ncbi:hypothetical protein [Bacteroides sp.]
MNDYIFLIALGIVFCSLIAVMTIFLHCLKVKQQCNYHIAKNIREKDYVIKKLEQTRIEKEMIEKVLKTELSETVKTSVTEKRMDEEGMNGCRKYELQIDKLKIDITYFV